MGVYFCSNKEKSPSGGKRPTFNFVEAPHKKILIISDGGVPCCCDESSPDMKNADDGENKPTIPIDMSKIPRKEEGTKLKASSYNDDLLKNRIRNNTDPFQPAVVAYSSMSKVLEQTIFVEDELLEVLSAKPQQQLPIPTTTTQRLSLSRKSMSGVQKKLRVNEDVIIHRITHADKEASQANPEMYKLVIALKEVWRKLDLDADNYLNLSELTRFCKQIWEEPVEDGGAQKIMEVYAKEHPEKGVNFHEWCILIKEEDPDLRDFVEEIYEIFVDPASQYATETD